MLRWVPPAADRGPRADHAGAARRCTKLHRRAGAGCGLYRDHWPCMGRGSYASTHANLGTAGRETLWGSRAARGPEELLN